MATLAPVAVRKVITGKRAFDVIGACVILLLALPIIAAVAAILIVTCDQIIFRHRRVGRHGEFDCFKFRTMCAGAEGMLPLILSDPLHMAEWERGQKLSNDPRVTLIGRFLRKTSLDELPQLVNVLRGEMSLVGPRPVHPDELRRYGSAAIEYLSVRPGLTGLWQVSGRSNTTFDERVALDSLYVASRSMALDLAIVARTIPAVIKGCGAH